MEFSKELVIGDFLFSTDKRKLDIDYVHNFLSTSYWAPGIPKAVVQNSIDNALSIGIYRAEKQIGFARLITDFSTYAYLADVFVDESYRGRGASKNLMTFIMSFEFIAGLRRLMLATRDAHGLYRQFGFETVQSPDKWMEINCPGIYLKNT